MSTTILPDEIEMHATHFLTFFFGGALSNFVIFQISLTLALVTLSVHVHSTALSPSPATYERGHDFVNVFFLGFQDSMMPEPSPFSHVPTNADVEDDDAALGAMARLSAGTGQGAAQLEYEIYPVGRNHVRRKHA